MDNLLQKTEKLIGKAMKMWDMKGFRPESIDPVVRLLIACVADESTRLEHMIDQASSNITRHLTNTLLPNHLALGSPAHGMIQAKPVESYLDLHTGMAFFYDKPSDLKNKKLKQQIGFCPALPMRLLRAELKYIYGPNGLKVFAGYNDTIKPKQATDRKRFWIGLDLDDAINSLEGLGFYLVIRKNWNLTEVQHVQTGLVDNARLYYRDTELEIERGFDMDYLLRQHAGSAFIYNQQERLSYYDWIKSALYSHNKSFFRIKTHDQKANPLVKTVFPDFFNDLFCEEDLEPLDKQPLVWLELGIDHESVDMASNLDVFINAIPVVNIQSRMITLSPEEPVKCLPIGHAEQFMGVSKHCSFDIFHNAMTEHDEGGAPYMLRTLDMERSNGETYSERLGKIVDEIETNFAVFYEYFSLDDDEVETLREALQPLKLSLLKFAGQAHGAKQYYLIFNKENTPDVNSVEVNYMLSNGPHANEIMENEKLLTYNTLIDSQSLRFIAKTRGGTPPLTPDDKKRLLDYLMLSQNKLVSREDILRYCYFYLGEKVINAEASLATTAVGQGLRNCLIIRLSLDGKKCDQQEAEMIITELEQKIHLESASVIPVRVQATLS